MRGQEAAAFNLSSSIFPDNPEARGNLWTLANEAAEAEREVRDTFDHHRTEVAVKLSVDGEVWRLVKAHAKERRVSATVFAVTLLADAVRKL